MTVGLCALHVWVYGCVLYWFCQSGSLAIMFLYHFLLSVKCLYIFGTDMIFGRDIDGVHWVDPNDFGDSQTLNLVPPVGQSYHAAS